MDDPRLYPAAAAAPADAARLHRLAEDSLAAGTGAEADAFDSALGEAIDGLLQPGYGEALAALFDTTSSASIYRHLWRILVQRERTGAPDPSQLVRLFALPIVVVAGVEGARSVGKTYELPRAMADVQALTAILRDHHALSGNTTIALGDALVGAESLEMASLPELFAWRRLSGMPLAARSIATSPMVVAVGVEGVHLRFLVGSLLAAPGADPMLSADVGRWGTPLAQVLGRQLARPGVTVLALPRAPQPLVAALWQGRQAQREVGAQIFASNAVRRLRAATGEPTAVLSMHRTSVPTGSGELRLSLSSPFDPRQAEGFRCPLLPLDRVDDVVRMLMTLLKDCRVTDVRVVPGVHADRDSGTGMPLLFKGDAVSPSAVRH
ncbi:MAG: hypothetical protein IT521_00565 [Burkholderiales bacterium]|nr:hypothetical protein [Burkholderiales bacterium]